MYSGEARQPIEQVFIQLICITYLRIDQNIDPGQFTQGVKNGVAPSIF